jgi:FkbM family methyltransferase
MTGNWEPPYTFEEKLKYALIPPRLYIRQLAARALRKGEPELGLLPSLVEPGKIAVDVGANKGIYTYHLAKLAKRVEAFEPNPKIFRVLKRGLPRNAAAHYVALSNAPGTARLMVPARKANYSNQGATLSETKIERTDRGAEYGVVEVEARTLDSYNFSEVGFIKIDVEGFEREVLEGSVETIARDRPTLLIEIEEAHNGKPI